MRTAAIFDRDGTLARIEREFVTGERPDWGAFHAAIPFDSPVPEIVALTHAVYVDTVIICTGRQDNFRLQMSDWIHKHRIRCDLLLMRASGDFRSDDVVKAEIYGEVIAPNFDVRFVVDDRPSVCDMWRSKGLPLLQVTQPDSIRAFDGLG